MKSECNNMHGERIKIHAITFKVNSNTKFHQYALCGPSFKDRLKRGDRPPHYACIYVCRTLISLGIRTWWMPVRHAFWRSQCIAYLQARRRQVSELWSEVSCSLLVSSGD